jgi:hypothetical protein
MRRGLRGGGALSDCIAWRAGAVRGSTTMEQALSRSLLTSKNPCCGVRAGVFGVWLRGPETTDAWRTKTLVARASISEPIRQRRNGRSLR